MDDFGLIGVQQKIWKVWAVFIPSCFRLFGSRLAEHSISTRLIITRVMEFLLSLICRILRETDMELCMLDEQQIFASDGGVIFPKANGKMVVRLNMGLWIVGFLMIVIWLFEIYANTHESLTQCCQARKIV